MSTMNRMTAKIFYKSLDKYEAHKKLVEKAVDPVNPTLKKSHATNRSKLDDSFLELCHDWKTFKRDLNLTEDVFNGIEDDGNSPKYEYNDKWLEEFESKYYDLMEKSDDVLDANAAVQEPIESKRIVEAEQKLKQDQKYTDSLAKQVELSCTSITSSIDKILAEVRLMEDGCEGVSKVQSLKADLHAIDEKIDGPLNNLISQYVALLEDTEANEKEAMRANITKTEKTRISTMLIQLSKKIKESKPSTFSNPDSSSSEEKKANLSEED